MKASVLLLATVIPFGWMVLGMLVLWRLFAVRRGPTTRGGVQRHLARELSLGRAPCRTNFGCRK